MNNFNLDRNVYTYYVVVQKYYFIERLYRSSLHYYSICYILSILYNSN